eukprot:981472_1
METNNEPDKTNPQQGDNREESDTPSSNSNQAPQPRGGLEHTNDENEMVDNQIDQFAKQYPGNRSNQRLLHVGRTYKEWEKAIKYLNHIFENINSAEMIASGVFAPGMWNEKATKINKESELKKCHPVLNESKTLSRALKECLSPKYEFGQFSKCLTDGDVRISVQMAMLTVIVMKLME